MNQVARSFNRTRGKQRLEALRRYLAAMNEFSDRLLRELPQGRRPRFSKSRRKRSTRAGAGLQKLRMASELIPYLGNAGAHQVLRSVSAAGEPALPAVESVLGTFLGKAAASQLVDRMIARTR
jgi:hypothetical protein